MVAWDPVSPHCDPGLSPNWALYPGRLEPGLYYASRKAVRSRTTLSTFLDLPARCAKFWVFSMAKKDIGPQCLQQETIVLHKFVQCQPQQMGV